MQKAVHWQIAFSTCFAYWEQGFGNIQHCIFLLAWNPDACPKYAMVDYDNAEIASLKEVFPDSQVFFMWFSVLEQVTGAVAFVSHYSSYLIWFDNLPKNFSKFILTSAINLQEFELNKDLYLSKIFPNDYNLTTKNAL